MRLIINGAVRETPALSTVSELTSWLDLPAFGSALELNGEIIRMADHASTALHEGDRLEIVRLVGGG